MERFGENFRGGQNMVVCPLCMLHLDSQDLSLQCPEVRKDINHMVKKHTQHSDQIDGNKKKDDRKSTQKKKQKIQNNEKCLLRPMCHSVVRFPGH